MTTHRMHPNPEVPDPLEAVLFDDCERCAELARDPGALLDTTTLSTLMGRVYDCERARMGTYLTAAEADAGSILWGAVLGINRVTDIPVTQLLNVTPATPATMGKR